IAKEPAYQNKPRYCLLVFGPEATTRVWLVLDGNVLYVDRDGTGDLTGAGKRFENRFKDGKSLRFEAGSIAAADGKYAELIVLVYKKILNASVECKMNGDTFWQDTSIEKNDLHFADRPQDAPIFHFDGPLTLQPANANQGFVRGDKPTTFPVMVGTA